MNKPRNILAATLVLLVLAPGAFAQAKLYRWVSADGKTHYSDDLPPEALDQARDELSKTSGMTLKQIDRTRTPEERAAADAKADAEAKAADALAKSKQSDQLLLTSYPTEADLKHAYEDRVALVAEDLKTTRLGLDNQQESMTSLLTAASNLELADKPVGLALMTSIKTSRLEILQTQQAESELEAQTVSLRAEAVASLAHYRQVRASAASAAADH